MYSFIPLLALLPATYGAAVSLYPLALVVPSINFNLLKPSQSIELILIGYYLVETYSQRYLPLRCRPNTRRGSYRQDQHQNLLE
jgi:hypothetical protein